MAPLWQRLIFKNIFVIGSVETKTLRIAFQRKQVSEVLSWIVNSWIELLKTFDLSPKNVEDTRLFFAAFLCVSNKSC